MRTVASISLAVMCLASAAHAQPIDPFTARGIDLVPIKFTPTMESGLALEGGELQLTRSYLLQALLDFNVGILAAKNGNERIGDLMPFRADLHIMGAYQLHPRVEVSADLPITIGQVNNFALLEQQGFSTPPPAPAGLGAPRIMGRLQILKQSEFPIVGLAAVLEMRIPIGDQKSFLSDRGFVFAPRLAVERMIGPVRILGNIGWRLRTAPGRFINLYVAQEFTLGGGAIIDLPNFSRFQSNQLVAELNLSTPAEAPFTFSEAEALKTPFELLIGARTQFAGKWGAQLAVGKGLGPNGYGRETIRFALSLTYSHVPEPDDDNDGIPNNVDGCPDQAEDKDGIEDTDGCPEAREPDRDGDGVPDKIDQCPDTMGLQELDGCPDKDGDQIPDNVDKCPDVPGTPDLNGCPPPEDEEEVVLESERIRINNQILFEFGSDRIDPRSFKLLDEVGSVLTKNPDVGPVLIEGHTDNVGSREANMSLSKRRAMAVVKYLTGKGIAPKRLRSEGYGFDKPIATNDTPLGRAKNRRTEFKLVDEIEEKPQEKPAPK
ncbi:MAG: OmpA family protein [Archangium sp.]|nr:OmpA family protein [Archangium sp.]